MVRWTFELPLSGSADSVAFLLLCMSWQGRMCHRECCLNLLPGWDALPCHVPFALGGAIVAFIAGAVLHHCELARCAVRVPVMSG